MANTKITAANIDSTSTGITFADLTVNGDITGTLATAAQTNITSLGTLTSLTVSGTITSGAITSNDRITGDGTEAAPAFRFATDTNTGMFPPSGGDVIGFATGGVERLRITSAGLVGIGIDNPSGTLHVRGETNSNGAELFLQVNNNNTTDNLGAIHWGNNTDNTISTILSGTSGNSRSSYLTFSTSSTGTMSEAMRIDSSQNLLVGKTSTAFGTEGFVYEAGAAVEVTTDSNRVMRLNRTTSDGNIIEFNKDSTTVGSIGTDGGSLVIGGGDVGIGFYQGSDALVPINGGTRAVRDSAIDLGMSDSRFKDLYLSGTANVGGVLELQSNNSGFPTTGMVLNNNNFVYLRGGSNGLIMGKAGDNEAMRLDSSGSLFIGTTSEATGSTGGVTFSADSHGRRNLICASTATGTIELLEFRNPNGTVGTITTNGSSTSYNTSSDYRLKENVDYDFTALDRVAQLKPARFNFKADENITVDGFLAHEVQDIVPEAVTGEKDAVDDEGNPDYQGIDQSKLVPLLTKAIQEQQTVIDDLKSRIETLEG